MAIRILIAPSGFKESIEADEVCHCISKGIKNIIPDVMLHNAPLVDGGEGFTKALVKATDGDLFDLTVTGPTGNPVQAHFGIMGKTKEKTAIIEMAAAAGLRHVPRNERNPLVTTTFGVGELVRACLDQDVKKILIGCGDSGTNDGGAGMAQALGVKLLDVKGDELSKGGGSLTELHSIDMTGIDKRLSHTQIDVALNWHNILCGPNGVARVFGPQKGASAEVVEKMANALDTYADVIEKELNLDVREINGGGASGGLGAGLYAFLGATLHSRYDIVMQYLDIESLLKKSDLVITAEGAIDKQTPKGKIPSEVARRAKKHNLPVIAIAGTIGDGSSQTYDCGIDAISGILETPCSLTEAIDNTKILLTNAAERVSRLIVTGSRLKL